MASVSSPVQPLLPLFVLFLRLGVTAFGGPAAHIALLREEVVTRRGWLTEAEFLDLLGATNLIPGPNSTEMVMHVGLLRGGWRGLVIAGVCFIVPAALIVSGFAWAYLQFGTLPQVSGVLYGVKPVILAVVAQAIAGLVKPALKTPLLIALALLALVLSFLGLPELMLLSGAGALAGIAAWIGGRPSSTGQKSEGGQEGSDSSPFALLGLVGLVGVAVALVVVPSLLTFFFSRQAEQTGADGLPFGHLPLFLFFLKVGSVLYGSGYVLLAFLQETLVSDWRWLTGKELLDAVAVGQVTPGPVFTTATFIGYLKGGPTGAVAATVGIFLPAFLFVALSGPLIPRIRRSPLAGAFLDGVNAAALALMASVTVVLARDALLDLPAVLLSLGSAFLLIRYRVNSVWLLLAGAGIGLLQVFWW